jgi:hypothetical protein
MDQLSSHDKFDNLDKYAKKHENYVNDVVAKPSKPKLGRGLDRGKKNLMLWKHPKGMPLPRPSKPKCLYFS